MWHQLSENHEIEHGSPLIARAICVGDVNWRNGWRGYARIRLSVYIRPIRVIRVRLKAQAQF